VVGVTGAYANARVPVILVTPEPVMIMVDSDELRRAVGNVVDNAVRRAATRVEVAARATRTRP
jgi:signal transduction histidine kinase